MGLLVALGLLAGCTTTDAEHSVALPPRPRDVRIDGIEPCSLLTAPQRAELGLDGEPSSGSEPSALFGGDEPACVVRGYTPRAVTVGLGLVTTTGIELFTRGELEAVVSPVHVQGFPAVVALPNRFMDFCSVFVDVAPGQLLDVQFADGGREPPIPQDRLCHDAEQVADAAMRTLLGR